MASKWSSLVGWTERALRGAPPSSRPITGDLPLQESTEDDAHVWRVPLEGFSPKDLEVTAHGRELRIRGERTSGLAAPAPRKVETVRPLPRAVDPIGIHASFEEGVLTLRLPKPARDGGATLPARAAAPSVAEAPGEGVGPKARWLARLASWCRRGLTVARRRGPG